MSKSKKSEPAPAEKKASAEKKKAPAVPSSAASSSSSGSFGRGVTAVIALAIALGIVILVNYAANAVSLKADLTENKLYTLSKGTKNILSDLETPVTLRYFVTDGSDVMTPREKALSRRIEDVLSTYVSAAPAKEIEVVNEAGELEMKKVKMISVEKLNPEPSTDAEDAARLEGLQPIQSPETGNQLYAGVVAQCIDAKEKVEVMTFSEERLEYELSRAITNVHGGKGKMIRVMTSVPVAGGAGANFQAPPRPALAFYDQLKQDYQVETLSPQVDEIPDDTEVLIVMHPFDITQGALFAIDQFILRGGNVVALVDPNFFYAETFGTPAQFPGMPPQGAPAPSSDLTPLFNKWGIKYDVSQVVADFSFGVQLGPDNFVPTLLNLPRNAMMTESEAVIDQFGETALEQIRTRVEELKGALAERTADAADGGEETSEVVAIQGEIAQLEEILKDDAAGEDSTAKRVTAGINGLTMLTPGGFEISTLAEGIKATPLVQSSPNNQLVPSMQADPRQPESMKELREQFNPYNKRRAFVIELTGMFPSAYPDGNPMAEDLPVEGADGVEKEEPAKAESLKKAEKPGTVVLISDVDFIFYEGFRQLGLRNQNLTLFQNTVEIISGDPNLVDVRSRENVGRRFTKPNEWQAEAQQKFQAEINEIQRKESEVVQELTDLIQKAPEGSTEVVLDEEMQAKFAKLEEEQIAFGKRTRELQKEVTREFKSKLANYKFGNALIMPALVILFGIFVAIGRKVRTAAR